MQACQKSSGGIDAVFVEDNVFIRETWRIEASAQGLRVLTLAKPEDFDDYDIDLVTPIFVDVSLRLGSGDRSGIHLAIRLHEAGYQRIWLASAHDELDDCPSFIKGNVGKEFPAHLWPQR